MVKCWSCTCEFDANEVSFCNHTDPTLICPFCLNCACQAPEDYRNKFLQNCPQSVLEEKLILESRSSLRLGELLIRAGKINRNDLLEAINTQKSLKQRIGQIFVKMNLLSQEELALFLMEQQGVDKINLKNFEVDFALVEKLGKDFCLKHRVIPVEFYRLNENLILRLVIQSTDTLLKLKRSARAKNLVIIPYVAEELIQFEKIMRKIKDYDVMVLQ